MRSTKRLTTEQFIEKSIKIHENNYDYSKFVYKNNKTKSTIICQFHGEFLQRPNEHLTGYGCRKCGRMVVGEKFRKNKEDFVNQSNLTHDNKYDYSQSVYIKNRRKVVIICPIHGKFLQEPIFHSKGYGCPHCKSSKAERKIASFLKQQNIEYISQKTFDDCRSKRPLKFDFYVPSKNLLIEYDGKQHFEANVFVGKHFLTSKDLKVIQRRDEIKNEYAKRKGIRLIRIGYTQFDDIEKILKATT